MDNVYKVSTYKRLRKPVHSELPKLDPVMECVFCTVVDGLPPLLLCIGGAVQRKCKSEHIHFREAEDLMKLHDCAISFHY